MLQLGDRVVVNQEWNHYLDLKGSEYVRGWMQPYVRDMVGAVGTVISPLKCNEVQIRFDTRFITSYAVPVEYHTMNVAFLDRCKGLGGNNGDTQAHV